MKLLIQPGSGLQPLLSAIERARKTIEIVIFRFDERELEKALASAVARGIFVRALIAQTSGTGEEQLRKLEMRFLDAGIHVVRTSDDLIRYHYKMMLVDRRYLFVLSFNFTGIDISRSRSFGIITTQSSNVQEAVKLFEADCMRKVYEPGRSNLVVSPVNARERLTKFLKDAKKELLIYDLRIGDQMIFRTLEDLGRKGVAIRVIGRVTRRSEDWEVREMPAMRLHARVIVRDRQAAFVGSQSLRTTELDARREVGIILRDKNVVKKIAGTFDDDWERAAEVSQRADKDAPASKLAKKVAKSIVNELPPVAPVVAEVVEELTGSKNGIVLNEAEMEESIKQAVKQAVKGAVREAVERA